MSFILKYFFGIGTLIGLINTIHVRKKMIKINQNIEDDQIKTFVKWYGISMTIPLLLIQLFQILGNYQTCFYLFFMDFNNPYYIMAFITLVIFWALLLYLVIIKNGAEIIAKYNKVFIRLIFEINIGKNLIKIMMIIIVLAGIMALLLGNKVLGGSFYLIEGVKE